VLGESYSRNVAGNEMSWLLAHRADSFLIEIAATLMAAYRHDRFKSADISLLITLFGKIGFSGRALCWLVRNGGVEAQKCMSNLYFVTANQGRSHLAAAGAGADIDFPGKAATETLPIAFQRSLFSDEIERRLWGNLRCFAHLSGGETIGGYSCEPQFSP
jgi:hypothetical protein